MSSLLERAPTATKPARVHLDYLDGLRALMALWVVLGHVAGGVVYRPGLLYSFIPLLLKNHYPVDVFIVLSGFCLTLPVARTGKVRGGAAVFFKSRIRRILPPYYAALFLSAALYILYAHWMHPSTLFPQALTSHPAPGDKKAFLTYLFVLADFFPQYRLVDGPLWSVACEFKIYFLFPVILWLLTRYGRLAALGSAAALGYAIMGLWWLSQWPHNHTSCPWYLFLFVMGVCAAQAVFGDANRALPKFVWLSLFVVPFLTFFAVIFRFYVMLHRDDMPFYPILDPLLGMSTAAALAMLSGRVGGIALRPVVKLLSWRPLVFVGTFSYSIYLIHMPLQAVLHAVFEHIPVLKDHVELMLLTLGTVLVVGISYLFFLAFERPFLNTRRAETPAETARDAVLSPAP